MEKSPKNFLDLTTLNQRGKSYQNLTSSDNGTILALENDAFHKIMISTIHSTNLRKCSND